MAQRPQRSIRSHGQSLASQLAIASESGASSADRSARTQDCTVTSQSVEALGYGYTQPMTPLSRGSMTVNVKPVR